MKIACLSTFSFNLHWKTNWHDVKMHKEQVFVSIHINLKTFIEMLFLRKILDCIKCTYLCC